MTSHASISINDSGARIEQALVVTLKYELRACFQVKGTWLVGRFIDKNKLVRFYELGAKIKQQAVNVKKIKFLKIILHENALAFLCR